MYGAVTVLVEGGEQETLRGSRQNQERQTMLLELRARRE